MRIRETLFIAPKRHAGHVSPGEGQGFPPLRVENASVGGRTPGLPPRLPGADGAQGGPPHLCRCEGEPRTWPATWGRGRSACRTPRGAFARRRPEPRAPRAVQGGPGGVSARVGRPGGDAPLTGRDWIDSAPVLRGTLVLVLLKCPLHDVLDKPVQGKPLHG